MRQERDDAIAAFTRIERKLKANHSSAMLKIRSLEMELKRLNNDKDSGADNVNEVNDSIHTVPKNKAHFEVRSEIMVLLMLQPFTKKLPLCMDETFTPVVAAKEEPFASRHCQGHH